MRGRYYERTRTRRDGHRSLLRSARRSGAGSPVHTAPGTAADRGWIGFGSRSACRVAADRWQVRASPAPTSQAQRPRPSRPAPLLRVLYAATTSDCAHHPTASRALSRTDALLSPSPFSPPRVGRHRAADRRAQIVVMTQSCRADRPGGGALLLAGTGGVRRMKRGTGGNRATAAGAPARSRCAWVRLATPSAACSDLRVASSWPHWSLG